MVYLSALGVLSSHFNSLIEDARVVSMISLLPICSQISYPISSPLCPKLLQTNGPYALFFLSFSPSLPLHSFSETTLQRSFSPGGSIWVGAIDKVPQCHRGMRFYSHYYLIPKVKGGLQPILDLCQLNRDLKTIVSYDHTAFHYPLPVSLSCHSQLKRCPFPRGNLSRPQRS